MCYNNNNTKKRSLFTINLTNCTIYLHKGREFKKMDKIDKIEITNIICECATSINCSIYKVNKCQLDGIQKYKKSMK